MRTACEESEATVQAERELAELKAKAERAREAQRAQRERREADEARRRMLREEEERRVLQARLDEGVRVSCKPEIKIRMGADVVRLIVCPKSPSEWEQTLALKGQAHCQPKVNT